ncbi:fatty acyl-AMP ligase [Streptomyces sp. NPDC016469]|uniref:fatty acyl-AMP ligase n=1 Tax=Streptomyces sp. NPDC016469 TaxID=3157191 RepID=UPI0033F86499
MTFSDVFASWQREDTALHFDGDPEEKAITFAALSSRTADLATRFASLGLSRGDRIVLAMSDARQFILSLVAALRAGLVVVPAAPPSLTSRGDAFRDSSREICRVSGASLCLTGGFFTGFLADAGLSCPVETFESLTAAEPAGPVLPPDAGDLALIQFTSGSTGSPKGVVVRHGELLAHVRALSAALAVDPETDRGVSWLPFHHDMGLIGKIFVPLLTQTSTWYVPPLSFVRDPAGFLRIMSEIRGTISFAPNFAYGLLAAVAAKKPPTGLDLSAWRIAGCGAEPVSAATLRRFADAYADSGFRPGALRPCYGMAEAVLAVSVAPPADGPRTLVADARRLAEDRTVVPATGDDGVVLTSSGRPIDGTEIRILDPDGRPLEDGREGEITLSGEHLAHGYHEDPDETGRTWRDGRLHTGDLGFLSDGELFVTGRIKDLIIVNGRNHHPHTIEQQVEAVPGVRPGGAVAVSVPRGDSEAVRIVAEARSYPPPAGLAEEVAARVGEQFGLRVADVTVVRKGTVPKTSSGKKQRRLTAGLLESGRLVAVPDDPAPQPPAAQAPVAREPSPVPVIGSSYVVKAGDTITEIAFTAYGDARRHQELALHNKNVEGFNAARLRSGMEIDIPEPDYLPMPSGLGGLRGNVGRSFSIRPVGPAESRVRTADRKEGRQS